MVLRQLAKVRVGRRNDSDNPCGVANETPAPPWALGTVIAHRPDPENRSSSSTGKRRSGPVEANFLAAVKGRGSS
jgi:hypothetical protein